MVSEKETPAPSSGSDSVGGVHNDQNNPHHSTQTNTSSVADEKRDAVHPNSLTPPSLKNRLHSVAERGRSKAGRWRHHSQPTKREVAGQGLVETQSTDVPQGQTQDAADDNLEGVVKSGRFHLRGRNDDLPQDWWFASTAIPLIAATIGPMANVMSIVALVTSWRNNLTEPPTNENFEDTSVGFPDPHWCIALNTASLICGFVGNFFLLLNFTQAIRYIIALPMTIILWYFATGILTGITIAMNKYVPPGPNQIYSQGYWHAVIASCLYMFSSMILMINMVGYFLGHYPQHFTLTDEQRNLILQTILFFVWLAGGAVVFAHTNDMNYPDAIYFCDVTILTIGFGDFYPTNDVSRGIIFPFSVGGIIILGLMVSSIHRFAQELGQDKIIKKHLDRKRQNTASRAVTTSSELETYRRAGPTYDFRPGHRPSISAPIDPHQMYDQEGHLNTPSDPNRAITINEQHNRTDDADEEPLPEQFLRHSSRKGTMYQTMRIVTAPVRVPVRVMTAPIRAAIRSQREKHKLLILKEEKDRFDTMRRIQYQSAKFNRWFALTLSVTAFAVLWCVGAVVFMVAEKRTQDLSYFEALYFCYVSLLTIGYGDLSPRSNAGKPFFIVWSLIAVPTMTILISDMGDTVIDGFKKGIFRLADWTVLPKQGIYATLAHRIPWLNDWLERQSMKRKLKAGFEVGPAEESMQNIPTIEELAKIENCSEAELTRQLAFAIRRTAEDLKYDHNKRYTYEQWVEYTRLIRFTHEGGAPQLEFDEEEYGIVEWDWIGEDSPMLSEQTETEWVLDRLCESLLRLLQRDKITVRPEVEARDKSIVDEEMSEKYPDTTEAEPPDVSQPSQVPDPEPDDGHFEKIEEDEHEQDEDEDQEDQAEPDAETQEEPLYRSIDDIVDSTPAALNRPSSSSSRTSSMTGHPTVEPRHRGIGLFPELDTDGPEHLHHHPPPHHTAPPRPSFESTAERNRRFSAISGAGSAPSVRPSLDTRRRSSTSGVKPSISPGPTRRKGPFSRLPSGLSLPSSQRPNSTRRTSSGGKVTTLKHRLQVRRT